MQLLGVANESERTFGSLILGYRLLNVRLI